MGYELAVAGGVTTAQVLPGSANNIGMSPGVSALVFTYVLVQLLRRTSFPHQIKADCRSLDLFKSPRTALHVILEYNNGF